MTLQYSGDIIGTFLKEKFVECSSNILATLPCDYWNLPKDQLCYRQILPFQHKNNFSYRICSIIFSFNMFLKCSLDAWNIATLREHSASIPGILRIGLATTYGPFFIV